VRVLGVEEACQLERRVALAVVEQQREGVAEDRAEQAAGEVPRVARPGPPDALALGQLAEDGVEAVAQPTQGRAPSRLGIAPGRAVGGDEADAPRGERGGEGRRPGVAVADGGAAGRLGQPRDEREVVGVGRGDGEAREHAGPGDAGVDAAAVHRLPRHHVLAEGGLATEAAAARGAGEAADRQREAVEQRERRVVRSLRGAVPPQALLDPPQVGGLAGERGPMDLPQRREPVAVVPPEVALERRVGLEPQVLADDRDR